VLKCITLESVQISQHMPSGQELSVLPVKWTKTIGKFIIAYMIEIGYTHGHVLKGSTASERTPDPLSNL
jgi:hypothetical protein